MDEHEKLRVASQMQGHRDGVEITEEKYSHILAARDAKIAELETRISAGLFLYRKLEARIAVKDAALQMAGQFINPIHTGNLHIRDMVIKTIHEALTSSPSDLVERLKRVEDQEIIGAVARGWCHSKNGNKEMDSDLAYAIVEEIKKLKSPTDAKDKTGGA